MCDECPAEVTGLASRLAEYIDACDGVISGGLHIVIEDENVATHHIEWCQQTQNLDAESARFAADLLSMPLPYRHMAVQMAWNPQAPAPGHPETPSAGSGFHHPQKG